MKNVVVFGSTGSIGRAALDIISSCPERFSVFGLVANRQKELLIEQIQRFSPAFAIFNDGNGLKPEYIGNTKCFYDKEALEFLATHPDVDIIVMAISGLAGLIPTLNALDAGKTIALATKEIVVCAGHLLSDKKGKILPVDSEHNAIFQILERHNKSEVNKIILTASGGPFLSYKGNLSDVTISQVLNHPVWKMGKRITVDSATMMNKGLEIIEAHYLFNIEKEKIDVVLHPQAIIHGLAVFLDGFITAILSNPDMRYSINYCLNYPERLYTGLPEQEISDFPALTFEEIKKGRFPCFDIARDALRMGGSYLTVLNAADEESVGLFLEGLIKFDRIPIFIEKALANHKPVLLKSAEDILFLDSQVKEQVRGFVKNKKSKKD